VAFNGTNIRFFPFIETNVTLLSSNGTIVTFLSCVNQYHCNGGDKDHAPLKETCYPYFG